MQIPIASTATKESAGNLDRFINFLCLLNIIYPTFVASFDWTGFKTIQAEQLQSALQNLQSVILHRGLSSVGRAPQWH
jgi:hypothetical protein